MVPSILGLQYVPEYLDSETHDRLLAAVDRQPWLMSVDHRVQIYGYNYSHAKRAAFRIGDLPPWATDLSGRLCSDGLLPKVPDQMVANDYRPGSGIFAHVDQAVLGDIVASVSLGSTCVMRFSHGASGQVEELLLEPRSVLVLSGEARWAWQHEIPARTVDTWENEETARSRRVSLTFRVITSSSKSDRFANELIGERGPS
jgi:alkylated DNA repair dioxygenase AlkB